MRILKKYWDLRDSKCFRRFRNGRWTYWKNP